MTRGIFTASVAVTAALSIGPTSSGLMNFQARRAGTSIQATDHSATAEQSTRVPLPATQPSDPREIGPSPTDPVGRPRLTMVPPRNPKLESRLQRLLPESMTIREAAAGFADQSQFVSAVHVSRNLGIPFEALKAKIVDERMTLGQAIRELRPNADVWGELTRARDLTARDIY